MYTRSNIRIQPSEQMMAVAEVSEIEEKVMRLFNNATKGEAGFVALRLLYRHKVFHNWRGHHSPNQLIVAIAGAVLDEYPGVEYTIWREHKQRRCAYKFKIRRMRGYEMPNIEGVPSDPWTNKSKKLYFVHVEPEPLPF